MPANHPALVHAAVSKRGEITPATYPLALALHLLVLTYLGKMKEKIKVKCLEDGDAPRAHDDLRGEKVGTFIVYVDDLLAAGEKKVLKGFFTHLH
eukprot:6469575-Amphidinium_carterae.1